MSSTSATDGSPRSLETGPTVYTPVTSRNASMSLDEDHGAVWAEGLLQPPSILNYNWSPPADDEAVNGRSLLDIVDAFRDRAHGKNPATTRGKRQPTSFIFARDNTDRSDFDVGGRFEGVMQRSQANFFQSRKHGDGDKVCFYFHDSRDAQQAMEIISSHNALKVDAFVKHTFIDAEEYCIKSRDKSINPGSFGQTFTTGYPGQLIFSVKSNDGSITGHALEHQAKPIISDRISSFADLESLITVDHKKGLFFRAQLYQHHRADKVFNFFRDQVFFDGLTIICKYPIGPTNVGDDIQTVTGSFNDDLPGSSTNLPHSDGVGPSSEEKLTRFGVIGQNRSINSADMLPNRMIYSYRPHRFDFREIDLSKSRGRDAFNTLFQAGNITGSSGIHVRNYHNMTVIQHESRDHKNFIEVWRIISGQDVRTTVMLRNIPNRLTHEDLRRLLNQYCFGRYDFLYLRIDFTNNCNVGYAFINFVNPADVAALANNVAGQKWLQSDKIAEVSYATMQGRETLIQKFRNSSVMKEAPSSRPKLYYAMPHQLAGLEEEFPGCDNPAKLERSQHNAANIGLFSPQRGVIHANGNYRRGHGQFDRGTTFAAAEQLQARNAAFGMGDYAGPDMMSALGTSRRFDLPYRTNAAVDPREAAEEDAAWDDFGYALDASMRRRDRAAKKERIARGLRQMDADLIVRANNIAQSVGAGNEVVAPNTST